MILKKKKNKKGAFLVVQWLRFHASKAGGQDSVPGWELDPTCSNSEITYCL